MSCLNWFWILRISQESWVRKGMSIILQHVLIIADLLAHPPTCMGQRPGLHLLHLPLDLLLQLLQTLAQVFVLSSQPYRLLKQTLQLQEVKYFEFHKFKKGFNIKARKVRSLHNQQQKFVESLSLAPTESSSCPPTSLLRSPNPKFHVLERQSNSFNLDQLSSPGPLGQGLVILYDKIHREIQISEDNNKANSPADHYICPKVLPDSSLSPLIYPTLWGHSSLPGTQGSSQHGLKLPFKVQITYPYGL